MIAFIQVTEPDGEDTRIVNVDHIVEVEQLSGLGYCQITDSNGKVHYLYDTSLEDFMGLMMARKGVSVGEASDDSFCDQGHSEKGSDDSVST